MVTTVDELQVVIGANSEEFQSEMQKTQKQLNTFSKSFDGISAGMATAAVAAGNLIAKAVEKIVATVSSNIDYAVRRLDSLNRFPIVMQNLGISTSEATNAINSLSEYTLGLPTTLNDAAEKVQYFTSATNNVWQSIKIFQALNDAIVSGAQTADVQNTALYQWSQAIVRGSFDIEREFNAMVVANAKAVNEISERLLGTGKNFNDLWEALKNGTVTTYDMVNAMVYLDQNGVGGLESWGERARKSVAGIDTAIVRFKTNIGKAVAVVASEIGWKNIYTFVNNVGDAIYKAGTYVAAFTRILKEAFAWVSALFGGGSGSTSEVVKETGSAASNTASMASGAADTADGLSDAAGAAKKLNKQLAAFDEMNVLREQDASGGGGSGGGGAGGGGAGGYNFDWDTSIVEGAADKIAKLVDKLKKKLKELFGEFDIEKIGKAIKRFVEDVKKFTEPIMRILSDIWNEYLRPLVNWTGNELLPAFLNALGGAINLVGTVIGTFWDKCLRPFIDDFLKPIAQWTGGIIVNVLNWIGDALRGLASNQGAVDAIAGSLKLLMEAFISFKVVTAVSDAINIFGGALTALKGQASSVITPMSSLAFAVGSSTNNYQMMAAATQMAGISVGSFGTTLKGVLDAVISPTTIAMLGLVAVMEAVQVITEYVKLKNMEAAAALAEYNMRVFTEEEAHQAVNDAIQAQLDLKDQLLGIQKELADATLSLLQAQDNETAARGAAEIVARKYNMTLDEAKDYVHNLDVMSGNLNATDRELADTILELESKEGKLREAQDAVTKSKEKQNQASYDLGSQAWKEYAMQQLIEMQNKLNEGSYMEVVDALEEVSNATVTYTDENGKMCQITGEDMKNMADYLGDLLEDMDTDQSRAWSRAWESANYSTNNIRGAMQNLGVDARRYGSEIPAGISSGIQNGQSGVLGVIGSLGSNIMNTFKRVLGISSPSKVFAEFGGWIDKGLANGIESDASAVTETVSNLARDTFGAFNDYAIDTNISAGLSRASLASLGEATQELMVDAEQTPVHVVVKVGEDTLIDRIVSGINDLSQLSNRSVINV